LAEKGYDQQYGARPLNRAIQKYVEDPLAEEILKGTMSEGDVILVDHEENSDSLSFSKKPKEETIEQ
jgi:ATP-dependent Clp protease ATP-binding subunit ClpC